jgi:acyl-CoA synthetase (AMP-forming)/AMP-acid ligase II
MGTISTVEQLSSKKEYMLISDFLRQSAQRHPEKPAVWYRDTWMAYGELDARSNRLSNFLIETGIKRGDRVAILYENSFNYIISYFAILKAGALAVPLNTDTTVGALTYYLNHSGSKAIVTNTRFVRFLLPALQETPELEQIILEHQDLSGLEGQFRCRITRLQDVFDKASDRTPDVRLIDIDLASIVYTSGSTGKPKGVLLSHLNIVSNTKSVVEYLQLTSDDRIMVTLPFFYIYGQSLLTTHFLAGGSVVIDNQFLYPKIILTTMKKMEVTGFSGVPSTFMRMLNRSSIRETRLEALRYVTQAGGHMAPAIRKAVSEAFAPAQLYIMYGATEAAPRLTYLQPSKLKDKLASIGKAIPNVEVLVVDEHGQPVPPHETGEIVARGSNIMVGYWHDPEATNEVIQDGYYHTGDLGQIDEDGYIYVVGRLKDIIKANGYRVSAREVEDALVEIDGIVEAAVKGVEDETTGEAIKAYVVQRTGEQISIESILGKLRERLPGYKMPRYVEMRDYLPKNESGKIMKNEL